jgi:DNA ligase (NAD+)
MEKIEYNISLINILEQLRDMEHARGGVFKAMAYKKAGESIMSHTEDIVSLKQIASIDGIGTSIFKKCKEFIETGKVSILEKEKDNPIYVFHKIYGVGPKKALELSKQVTTIAELRQNTDLLNDIQKIGLVYYEDILERIPRSEVMEFKVEFDRAFDKVADVGDSYDIVGSFRRGNMTSGDIDVIISSTSGNRDIYTNFLKQLRDDGIIIEDLSRGKTKSLTIGKIPWKIQSIARRLDFMYAPPEEWAFSRLYFTGSKLFNMAQRKRANDLGLTMNEHGLYSTIDKKKISGNYLSEKSIFDRLGMVWKTPQERVSSKSVTLLDNSVKEKWDLFSREGLSSLPGLSEEELCDMIRVATIAYSNSGESMVTDSVFDILKDYGSKTYKDNPCFKEIGAPTDKVKVDLPYFMASMDKIKPDTEALNKYLHKYSGEKVISAKLDGISALYTTNGVVSKLYTRGNGTQGTDISYLIPYMKLPTVSISESIAIRGELIIDKGLFEEKYSGEYKNPRNMVSGVVSASKKQEKDKWNDIDFVGYEVISPILKPSAQMTWLNESGTVTTFNETLATVSNEKLSSYLVELRETYKYDIDGIIVTDNNIHPRTRANPSHSVAFKMVLSDQIAEAKVVNIIWTSSKDGYIKPVVQIEKIRLCGVDIEFVTAFNAKFVFDNKIGIGTIIEMSRRGDVIPHIQRVIQSSEIVHMPSQPWHWNETRVDAITDLEDDPDIIQKQIEYFFKTLDVPAMGPGNIKKMVEAGYNTVPKILAMDKDTLLTVRGFKDKTATKILSNIYNTVGTASLVMLASASNIFGRGIGQTIIQKIINAYPDVLESVESDDYKTTRLSGINGVGIKRATLFVSRISRFITFMVDSGLDKHRTQNIIVTVDKEHVLYGKRIVMTGPKDKSLKNDLLSLGAKIGTSVNSNTFVLLLESSDIGDGKKKVDAGVFNTPILTFKEFREKYL